MLPIGCCSSRAGISESSAKPKRRATKPSATAHRVRFRDSARRRARRMPLATRRVGWSRCRRKRRRALRARVPERRRACSCPRPRQVECERGGAAHLGARSRGDPIKCLRGTADDGRACALVVHSRNDSYDAGMCRLERRESFWQCANMVSDHFEFATSGHCRSRAPVETDAHASGVAAAYTANDGLVIELCDRAALKRDECRQNCGCGEESSSVHVGAVER